MNRTVGAESGASAGIRLLEISGNWGASPGSRL